MNQISTSNITSLFILLFSILLITSCLEMNTTAESSPAKLQGKWRLMRVEESIKTVSPPTDSIPVWIEFRKTDPAVDAAGFPFSFNGEALVNLYFGSYDVAGEELKVGNVASTERGGPVAHMAFDTYYYKALQNATSFDLQEQQQTLIIKTKENLLLVYKRYTDN